MRQIRLLLNDISRKKGHQQQHPKQQTGGPDGMTCRSPQQKGRAARREEERKGKNRNRPGFPNTPSCI